MFHVNETKDGKGELTVKDGKINLHVTLSGKRILNLYRGKAEKAKSDEKNWLKPTIDVVQYSDGTSEEVFGFDIPVESSSQEFDLALIGKKGKWYDHKVKITPVEKKN